MHLIVLHYHLLPGGVTDVIVHSIRAICLCDSSVSGVTLVAGRPDNMSETAARLADLPVPVRTEAIPELGYTNPAEPTRDAHDRASAIEELLLARFGADGSLWWIHNHHVGKNPALTLALCRIAAREASPRMLLHIHDFPECARYENLAYLTRIAGDSPYPAGPTVAYAVINDRDRRLLTAAGVPESSVGLLLNPQPTPAAPSPAADVPIPRDRLVARLADFAADHGYRFHPDGPILFYPIRAIRRKNVLEAAAVARLVPHANLIVTLPGVSEQERPYSDLVRYAYDDRRIHGIFGIGRREEEYALSYEGIARGSDLVISSSVQEGFGLLFVNALRWRRTLLARRLDVLSAIEPLFAGYPATFYDGFRVPMRSPSITSMQGYLRMRYQERIEEIGDVLPTVVREQLDVDLEELLAGESIDFSFLPPQLQLTVLGDIRDRGFGSLVRAMNAEVIAAVESVAGGADARTIPAPPIAPDRSAEVAALLGYESFAARFHELVAKTGSQLLERADGVPGDAVRTGGAPDRYAGVQDALVRAFGRVEQLRLLLGPLDHDPHTG